MKTFNQITLKTSLIIMVCAISTIISAQIPTLVNGGFEQWAPYQGPDTFLSYSTSNGFGYFLTCEATVWSVPGRTGDAIHLESQFEDSTSIIPGAVGLGEFCNGGLKGGLYYPHSPDSLVFWTRHNLIAGDTSFLAVFHRGAAPRIAAFHRFFGSQSSWMRISIPLPAQPTGFDTIAFIAYSSDPNGGKDGSWLELDDMELIGSTGPGLPNGGFEIWANSGYEDPDDWGTNNAPATWFSNVQAVTKSTDAAVGNYALQIRTTGFEIDCNVDTIGSINSGQSLKGIPTRPFAFDEFPIPFRLRGLYKYAPQQNDQGIVGILFYTYDSLGNSTLAEIAATFLPATNSYRNFDLEVDTAGWGVVPDSFHVLFTSSLGTTNGSATPEGSILLLDDLSFYQTPLAIDEPGIKEKDLARPLTIYPNPVSKTLNIILENEKGLKHRVRIIDLQGRVRLEYDTFNNETIALDLEAFHTGMYIVEVIDEHGRKSVNRFIKK